MEVRRRWFGGELKNSLPRLLREVADWVERTQPVVLDMVTLYDSDRQSWAVVVYVRTDLEPDGTPEAG